MSASAELRRLLYSSISGILLLTLRGTAAADPQTWTMSKFQQVVDGELADGGVNTYVAADGSVRLINLRDLNDDGRIDIVFPHTHDHNEVQNLRIFRSAEGYSADRRVELPTLGGQFSTAADLNGDGWPELIVVNRFDGTKSDLNSFVYRGTPDGFSAENRLELPTTGAAAAAVADLNGDGHPEIVFANTGLGYHASVDKFQKSFVYRGSAEGYAVDRRTMLPTVHANDVAISDLNGDGVPDIVFSCQGNDTNDSEAVIYWGSPTSDHSPERVTRLPASVMAAVEIADLNGDGLPELIVVNSSRLKGRIAGMYNLVDTVAVNSCIYWAAPDGYAADRRTLLPTVDASDVAVGDLNRDGQPDIVFANKAGGASWIYWGSEDGFRSHHRTSLPTQNATGCAIADLDSDGFPEIVFAQAHDGRQFQTDSLIYRGSASGYTPSAVTRLPTIGAAHVAIADLDRQSGPELMFSQQNDGTAQDELESWIYWGGEDHEYREDRRASVASEGSYHYVAADLNHDGHVDLCLPGHRTFLYPGDGTGTFRESTRSVVSGRNAFSACAADFNRDGYLDLAVSEWSPGLDDMSLYYGGPGGFSAANRFIFRIPGSHRLNWPSVADLNRDGWPDLVVPTWKGVLLYLNSADGFDNDRRSVLPAAEPIVAEIADLNRDGFLDIIVGNLFDTKAGPDKPQSFGGTSSADTFIYWGSASGYDATNRQVIPSVGNADIAVDDLNQDGYLDLVLTSYHAGYTRSHPSYIYWNSATGFDRDRVTMLPTDSASGVLVLDFNQDGQRDILFACHSKNGNHRTDSFLYWGNRAGYSTDRRALLPSLGVHYLSVVDAGDIYRRSDRYAYISPPHDAGPGARFRRLSWNGETPFRTRLEFQIRTAADEHQLRDAAWTGPNGPDDVYTTSGGVLADHPPGHRWIQYRAFLVSPDSVNTPILREVSIDSE